MLITCGVFIFGAIVCGISLVRTACGVSIDSVV